MVKQLRLPLKVILLIFTLLISILLYSISAVADAPVKNKKPHVDYFDLSLEQLLNIKVDISAGTESRQQFIPSAVTIITSNDIAESGGRTLNDVLNLHVPGYFKAEDKDDTISSFRGLAPDNNTKVLLLIDGVKVNAEWFWGPADSVLNGIGLDFIERIEVIRGAGSVVLGQGAQLGVINIVTKEVEGAELNLSAGEFGWRSVSTAASLEHNGLKYQFIASTQNFDGFYLPSIGWAGEVKESDSSHPAFPAERGNKLNRIESTRLLTKVSDFDWQIWFQHHQQTRDLYNWTKDRDQVEQRISIIAGDYYYPINDELTVKLIGNWQNDDYALYDHYSGLTTAGANEQRAFGQVRLYTRKNDNGLSWLLGAELEHIKTGDTNWQGDNFIVNKTENLTSNANETNTWLFDDSYTNKALLGELNKEWQNAWKANIGFRYDDHGHWGEHFTPRMSLTYQGDPEANVYRLTYQRGFKGPPGVHYSGGFLGDGLLSEQNFNQLEGSGMTSSTTGEPMHNVVAPKPESMTSYEFSVKGVADKYWSYEISTFYNRINNYILTLSTRNGIPGESIGTDRVGDWGGVFYYANQPGELKIRGIELSSVWKKNNWRHKLSYSTHDVVSAEGFDFGMKSPVAGNQDDMNANGMPEGIWRYQGFVKLNNEFSLSYQHILLERWWAPWTNTAEPGLGWGNVSVQWKYNQSLNLMLLVNNIWNENGLYPVRARGNGNDTPGTPALEPRNLSLTMKYRF